MPGLRPITFSGKIHWITRGDGMVRESDKSNLIAEAQRQLNFLKQSMKYQGLAQGRRRVKVGNFIFDCSRVMGLDAVTIRMMATVGGKPELVVVCYCDCQKALGQITAVYDSAVASDVYHCAPCVHVDYPTCAQDLIGDYAGARYGVKVCQCAGEVYKWVEFICCATDWEEYEVEESVIVLYIGDANGDWNWDLEDCGRFACHGSPRDKSVDNVVDTVDGEFIILPYDIGVQSGMKEKM